MLYGVIDRLKVKANPKEKGRNALCPLCGEKLIAKCGRERIWHWSHHQKSNCDIWHEHETSWHINWKNCFPVEWQEKVCKKEETGEKHIADIKTPDGFVIELQHSPINNNERIKREKFYERMLWVVDVSHKQRVKYSFDLHSFRKPLKIGLNFMEDPEKYFAHINWTAVNMPVMFDFGVSSAINDSCWIDKKLLYCILPVPYPFTISAIWVVTRGEFLSIVKSVKNIYAYFLNLQLKVMRWNCTVAENELEFLLLCEEKSKKNGWYLDEEEKLAIEQAKGRVDWMREKIEAIAQKLNEMV